MIEFGKWAVAILFAGLLGVLMISFAVNFGIANSTNVSILDNEIIESTYRNINQSLINSKSSLDQSEESFLKDLGFVGELGLTLKSILGFGTELITGFIPDIYVGMVQLVTQTFNIDKTVFTVFMGIFIIIMIVLAWQMYRAGV